MIRKKAFAVGLIGTALIGQALAVPASSASPPRPVAGFTVATEPAIAHVKAHPARFGLSASDVSDLLVTDAYRSDHNGVSHVYLRQRVHGLEVAGANMTVNVLPNGRILHIGSRFLKDLEGSVAGSAELDAIDALQAAADALGLESTGAIHTLDPEVGVARQTRLAAGSLSTLPIPAKLIYQPTEDGTLRLAWNLELAEPSGEHWWNVSIDATTGRMLNKIDLVVHEERGDTAAAVSHEHEHEGPLSAGRIGPKKRAKDGSKYRVYALPLESPNDGKRSIRKNPADKLASPFGWHDVNGKRGYDYTTTRGNNAHAYTDYTGPGNQALPFMDAEGGEGLDFDFPIDYSMPPQMYREAAVTNLFFWNNVIHDVFYRYGFDEKAGNFQMNNYKRGGKGNDPVQAQAQDSGGVNNANFATPADGIAPRMQMYIWPGTRQVIDGDMDSGVITHEYGHGISNRLTGGPKETGCLSSHDEREGEGWSDFLAIALTARKGDKGKDPRGMGTYVLGQESRKDKGIRPTAYSTSKMINPATYNTIKGAAEPHGVGYVWATMLWEVYWNLVDKHGFNPNPYGNWRSGGNNLAIQLVMDGMKMQPCEPGFVDSRDAILAAEKALTKGRNKCAIWAAFAKRGLGHKAKQNDPASKVDGIESYRTHPSCR